jgi:hypothetical protein
MGRSVHWLPGKREDQIVMAQRWNEVLETKATEWSVPQAEVTALAGLTSIAAKQLAIAKTSDRAAVVTAQGRKAFKELVAKMRFIKNRYFHKPPFIDADFVLLMLKPPNSIRTEVPTPVDQPGLEITKWALHLLGFRYFVATDKGGSRSNKRVRVHYGLVAPGAPVITGTPSFKRLAGKVHILSEPPRTADDLPDSFFMRRVNDTLDFPPEASGKICYLAALFENGSGEEGPWSAMISAVVP